MNELNISNFALALCITPVGLHGIEVLILLKTRFFVNWVVPFFGLTTLNGSNTLSQDEQLNMLDAVLYAVNKEKLTAPKDYLFQLLFEQRQGSIGFIAVAVSVISHYVSPFTFCLESFPYL